MFTNRKLEKRVLELEEALRELKGTVTGPCSLYERVSKLEVETSGIRAGEWDPIACSLFGDSRPKVTMRQAVEAIMEHLKIRFKSIPASSARVEIEKLK